MKSEYDVLSEYTHASALSTSGHYINYIYANNKPNTIVLTRTGVDSEGLKSHIEKCLQYIFVFEKVYEDFSALESCIADKLSQIVSKNKSTNNAETTTV